MNIAMTGATGYIGKHLSNYLTEKGGHRITFGKSDVSGRYVRTFGSDADALRCHYKSGRRSYQSALDAGT